MNTQNLRVQVYLDSSQVKTADELAEATNISRSQLIRDAVWAITENYIRLSALLTRKKTAKNPLLDMIGSMESKTGNLSQNIDEVSLYD